LQAIRPLPYTARPGYWDASGYNGDEPITPSGLLGLIKSAVSLTSDGSASGPGWTGTKYGFTVHPREPLGIRSTVTYTIEVDRQGLVRGFGTPVAVPPPASEIYSSGNQYVSVAVY
jgi:hypothetical protein